MDNESLIQHLKLLKTIAPDPVFLKWSRYAIMAHTPLYKRRAHSIASLFSLFRVHAFGTRAALALGSALALIFIIAHTIPQENNTEVIASLNPATIRHEQEAVTANNQANEERYFKRVSPNITLALSDISDPRTNWGSVNHIKKGVASLYEKNN